MNNDNQPKYPIYVISKGRWEYRHTVKALDKMGIDYYVVVEPTEYEQYAQYIDPRKILVLPFHDTGSSVAARNWVWDHSIQNGHERHWILDDNIRDFYRFNKNRKIRVRTGAVFRAAEDFTDRFKNVALSGFNYEMFIPKDFYYPPFYVNTRVYSCILVNNAIDFPWRGMYNEDTDLSLRVLKAGYCTILFNAFLADKIRTQMMKGGNTESVYGKTNNRYEFAKSLQEQHPDVVRIVWRYGRWHHHVDYTQFKVNTLKYKDSIQIPSEPHNYGMRLVKWQSMSS